MKLQEGEEILLELQPESNVLVIWLFSKCLGFVFVAGILGFLIFSLLGDMFSNGPEKLRFSLIITSVKAFVVCLAILILAFIYCIYLRRTYHYYITDRRCIFRGGIIRRVQHSVPYHKITDVEMSQNIIERMLGISSLGIFTPGTGSMSGSGGRKPEIAFVGLKDNETPAEMISGILSKFKATGQ